MNMCQQAKEILQYVKSITDKAQYAIFSEVFNKIKALHSADLSCADLSCADLSCADLSSVGAYYDERVNDG